MTRLAKEGAPGANVLIFRGFPGVWLESRRYGGEARLSERIVGARMGLTLWSLAGPGGSGTAPGDVKNRSCGPGVVWKPRVLAPPRAHPAFDAERILPAGTPMLLSSIVTMDPLDGGQRIPGSRRRRRHPLAGFPKISWASKQAARKNRGADAEPNRIAPSGIGGKPGRKKRCDARSR